MAELRDRLPVDRRTRFQAIVDILLELDAEACAEAIALADTLEQLEDPELIAHLRAQRGKDKQILRQVYAPRRRQHEASASGYDGENHGTRR